MKLQSLKSDRTGYLLLLLVLGSLVGMYWDVGAALVETWLSSDEYGHGLLIPFLTGYFIWQLRSRVFQGNPAPTWFGVVIVLLALLLYFVGRVADVGFLLRFSLVGVLYGVSLAILGIRRTWTIAIPIVLLAFSFPLPPVFEATLTSKLQLFSSQLGVGFIRLFHIPVYLEGNVIDLGGYKLQVIEACSGLRYLYPLMGLAFICAYLFKVSWWKRALIFFASIPISVLMNGFRVGAVGVMVDHSGISAAEGFMHDFEGWVIFLASFFVLFLLMWILSISERRARSWSAVFGLADDGPVMGTAMRPAEWVHLPLITITALLVLALAFIAPLRDQRDEFPPRTEFNRFPMQMGSWTGVRGSLESGVADFLQLSDYVIADYLDAQHREVNFYSAYYASQRKGRVPHSPKLCMPGGGWEIVSLEEVSLGDAQVNRVLIKKQRAQQLVYYWYKQRGKAVANEYLMKWNNFLGALNAHRTDVALVRLTTQVYQDETPENAEARLRAFKAALDPLLPTFVPD